MRRFFRFEEDRGAAMVTALLISMAVLSLSLVAVGLSIHNLDSSSYDRKRLQAIDVAESGIDLFSSVLGTSTFSSVPCPTTPGASGDAGANVFGDLPTTPAAHYDVYASFYSGWPPIPDPHDPGYNSLTCTQVRGGSVPAAALVKSVGTAVRPGTGIPVSRTMESLVRLTPVFGGLGEAVFSDTGLTFQNQLTINGNAGNDGDVYTNGNFTLANNTVIGGSVYAQRSATIGQGVIKVDVWAGGNVSLSSGISVFGNAIAAGVHTGTTGTMSLNNATVYGDAKAKGTITLSSNSLVKGTQTSGAAGLSAPPHQDLPLFCWPGCPGQTPSNATLLYYTCPTGTDPVYCGPIKYTEKDYSGSGTAPCTSAKNDIANWFGGTSGNYAVVINASCPLQWGNGTMVNVKGHLAIFSFGGGANCGANANIHGAICTVNNVTFNSSPSSAAFNVLFVRPYVNGLACSTGDYDITVSNSTVFNSLKIFIYSQCVVNFGNNNASGVNTQLIGGTVNLTNQMVLNFDPTLSPGFRLTGYKLGSAYLREIANG